MGDFVFVPIGRHWRSWHEGRQRRMPAWRLKLTSDWRRTERGRRRSRNRWRTRKGGRRSKNRLRRKTLAG